MDRAFGIGLFCAWKWEYIGVSDRVEEVLWNARNLARDRAADSRNAIGGRPYGELDAHAIWSHRGDMGGEDEVERCDLKDSELELCATGANWRMCR